MERQRCSECAAFNALNNECRREAPKPALISEGGQTRVLGMWPATRAEHWCLAFVIDPKITTN
jgi:hypothetical protein